MLSDSLPFWPVNPLISPPRVYLSGRPGAHALDHSAGHATLGRQFSFGPGAVATRGEDQGRMVGGIYAANTGGAIVGALAFSLVLIPWIGTKAASRCLSRFPP